MNTENQNIEFKESWRDEYLKWICGFSNAQGGKLCIGIDDEGHLKNAALLLFCEKPGRYFTGTEFKIGRFHSNIADLLSQEMIECSIIQMADRAAITPENIEKVHASYPRNKNLAFAFYKAGFIESWGRGWQKICDGFTAAGLPKPTIESTQGGVLVTFRRNNVNLKNAEDNGQDKDFLGNISNNGNDIEEEIMKSTLKSTLKGTLKRIVVLIEENPNITIDNVAELLQMNRRGIVKHFKNLQQKGIIRRIGPDKGGHWEIIKQEE